MVRTRVGYAGGTLKDPTYHNLGDHAESIQIDFDPTKITYAQLLDIFWSTHNPCHRAWSRQYMSAILYHNDEQKKLALETSARKEKASGKVHTEIARLRDFYIAEDYHQKYMLRNETDLMKEFSAIYPDAKAFVNSTAAARVNSWLGHPSDPVAKSDLQSIGLSPAGVQYLSRVVKIDSAK